MNLRVLPDSASRLSAGGPPAPGPPGSEDVTAGSFVPRALGCVI
jgi:hypothetical protein